MLVRDVKRCKVCGILINPGKHDVIIGLRNLRGWKTIIICQECLGDRKQFAKEYNNMIEALAESVMERAKPYLSNRVRTQDAISSK